MKFSDKSESGFNAHFLLFIKQPAFILLILLISSAILLYEQAASHSLSTSNYGADGGDYLTAVLTHGVPHPTGYPLYLLLSDPAQQLFSGDFVWRQAQVSVFPASICIGVTFLLILFLLRGQAEICGLASGVIASLALTISPLFWSQAVIIEVYALNAMLTVLVLLWIVLVFHLEANPSGSRLALITVLAWVCGLGLGNHRTFLLIYPLAAIGIYLLARKKHLTRTAVWCSVGWLSGLLTYLVLPVRAAAHPAVNWGDSSTWQGFFWLVRGGDYANLLFTINLQEYPQRMLAWTSLMVQQFGVVGCFVGLLGLFSANLNKRIKWMLAYVFVIYTLFALGYKSNDSLVYLLPALIVFAIWIGLGICAAWQIRWRGLQVGLILPALIILELGMALPGRWQAVSVPSGDLSLYAETTLTSAAPGALIYPQTDGETFSLWFYQYGLGMRPDVVIISRGLLQYTWYQENLTRIYPDAGPFR
jgi:hypothetical protein